MSAPTPSRLGPLAEIYLFALDHRDNSVREVSEAFGVLLGKPVSEISGRNLLELVYPDDRSELAERLADLHAGQVFECRFLQSNGQAVYVQSVIYPCETSDLWRVAGTDTADLVKLLAERRDLRTRLDLAVGQAVVAMWDLEVSTGAFNWESQAAQILGIEADRLPATAEALIATVHADDRDALAGALARLIEEGTTDVGVRVGQQEALRYLSLRGRVLDLGDGRAADRAVGILLDVTTEKALEEQLLRMSVSDGLTGVRNRRGFDQALRGEWRRCTRAGEPISILMVDIDRFKQFNDAYGHIIGDQALVAVTRALGGALEGEGDILARYGGEEFSVVLPGAADGAAEHVAGRLVDAVRQVKLRQAPDWVASVSVGSATWTPGQDKIKAPELLARADRALYAAKGAGRDRAVVSQE